MSAYRIPPTPTTKEAASSREPGCAEDAIAQLLPVAKACKLDAAQRPRDARDPRRSNRMLHLCQNCGAYKQSTEFCAPPSA